MYVIKIEEWCSIKTVGPFGNKEEAEEFLGKNSWRKRSDHSIFEFTWLAKRLAENNNYCEKWDGRYIYRLKMANASGLQESEGWCGDSSWTHYQTWFHRPTDMNRGGCCYTARVITAQIIELCPVASFSLHKHQD